MQLAQKPSEALALATTSADHFRVLRLPSPLRLALQSGTGTATGTGTGTGTASARHGQRQCQ